MPRQYELGSINARIDKDIKKHIATTRKLLMQPSSSQEHIGIEDCADLVADMYRSAGCDKVEIVKTKGNPVVQG